MGMIDSRITPGRESEKDVPLQMYLISTPAGGKYIISEKVFLGIAYGTTTKFVGMPALQFIFARKIGETKERFHHLPVAVSDISPYFESVPETEPVGCATVEKPSEAPDDHFDGSYDAGRY